jgi:SIR2-like domain/AAA domain/AAA domain, putative AbiEii toxin, Type IV TA system
MAGFEIALAATAVAGAVAVAGFWAARAARLRRRELEESHARQASLENSLEELRLAYEPRASWSTTEESGRGSEARIPGVPPGLVEACVTGDCLLFAGGGLAAQAGLPTWRELVAQIIRRHEGAGSSDWAPLAERVAATPNQIAEILASRLARDELLADVRAVVGRTTRQRSPIFRDLSRIPFTGAVTTSYDDLLEQTFSARSPVVLTMPESDSVATYLREARFVVLKLYGDLRRPDTFLFTPDEYAVELGSNPFFERTVASLFFSNTVLFLGASLEGIEDFFVGLRMRFERQTRRHYALVPRQESLEVDQERFLARYGVELVPYTPSPGHPEVREFVARLAALAGRGGRQTQSPATLRSAVIESVRLENIGPFRELKLDLNRRLNLLLGNNGSGKSTLLRAIALALCGDDERARGTGARLLRAGTSSGWIELKVGADVYRTELVRDIDGVSVKQTQLTPLQAGTWVILGFPPVRGITTRNPPPTEETNPNPLVTDVLPLLLQTTDERLDDVKGWLVSQSLRAEGGRGISREEAARARKLLRSFFGLLDDLTPGLRLEFDSCDRSTWQVIVKTVDGAIPIDFISQGTISVLGWVGTVLQRMYEIYPDSPQPEAEPAVVLVDEVDAHMHPEWQKALVPVLRARLPKLQLIATTHSPLVAGGMEPSEVTRIRRDEHSADIVLEPIVESLKGMRADQILTSPAFDLDTTRDRETVSMMNRYSELFGMSDRTEAQEREFQTLTDVLRVRVPSSPEKPVTRKALGFIEQAIRERIDEQPIEERRQILEEAARYMAKVDAETRAE